MYINFFLYFYLDSDDEDITAHRKPRRNAIKDSDSEEEQTAAENDARTSEALVLSASSGDETQTKGMDELRERGTQKSRRINRAPVDSDGSEPEKMEDEWEEPKKEAKPTKEKNKREKSRRHHEKKEKRSKAVEKVKRRKRFSENTEVKFSFAFFSC